MVKRGLAVFMGLATGIAEAAVPPALPAGAEPLVGRCHMGSCSWSAELGRETLRETAAGRLLRLRLLGGSSEMTEEDDYESAYDERRRIEWNAAPHHVYVFCSTRLPTVMVATEAGLQVEVLDLVEGPAGYQEADHNLYIATCHGRAALELPDLAARFGYRPRAVESLDLARPQDIFDHLP
jgi:hypothetical protein